VNWDGLWFMNVSAVCVAGTVSCLIIMTEAWRAGPVHLPVSWKSRFGDLGLQLFLSIFRMWGFLTETTTFLTPEDHCLTAVREV